MDLGLKGKRDQIIEHRQNFECVVIRGLVERSLGLRLAGPALTEFQTLLHIAHRREILVELVLVFFVHLL